MEGVIKSPATPRDESKRLQALHELGILDTPQEERFDRITRLVQATLGVPMSTISLVDSDRQWFKSRQNIDDSETPRDVSFCGHGILQAEIFEVSDASIDPRFSDNPLVTGSPHIRFYAGAPIATPDGHRIGMLCAISDEPRRLTERERLILRALADCVEAEINALEEKRLRTLLSHTQARTGKMLQAMPDIVLLIDQDGICLESNDHPDLLIPRSEIIGRRVSEALPPHLASQWQASFRQVLQQEGQVVFDYVLPLAKGPTYFEARLQWLNQNEVLALIRDVSVRKTSEDALTEQRRLTDSIQTAQSEFILANDHRLAFTALLADILALTNSEYGFIAEVLHQPEGEPYLKTLAITNIGWDEKTLAFYEANALQGMELTNLETLFGSALTSGKFLTSNDPSRDPRRGGLPEGHPALNAFLGIPVEYGGQKVAMIGVANRPGGYDEAIVEFLRPLTTTLGQLVYAHHLREQHTKTQSELARLSRVANETTNGVIITDSEGLVEWINEGFTRISGYGLDDLIGLKPGDVLQGSDSDPEVIKHMAGALAKEEAFDADLINYAKDGRPYWIRIQCSPLRNTEGVLEGYMAIESDITDEKQIQQELAQFKSTLDQTLDCVFMFEPESLRFIYVNQGSIDHLGYSRDELLRLHPYDIKPLIDEDDFKRLIGPLLNGEKVSETFETLHQHKNGEQIPVEIFLQYISTPDSQSRFVAIVRDIRERKRAEVRLRENEKFLSIALDSMPLPVFYKDKDGRYTGFNRAFEAFFGKSKSDFVGKTVFDIHPRELAEIYHAQDAELFRTVGDQVYEAQAKTGHGSLRDIVFHKATLTNHEGDITGLIGAIVDVTERKRADAEIHHLAFYDSLTDLPNRRMLQERLGHALALSRRSRTTGALVFLDLDDFKVINDTRGHDIGDQLLIEVAKRLCQCARESDTVARLGGDEFVVMLEDLDANQDRAAVQTRVVGEKIRQTLEVPYQLDSGEYRCSASIGITLFDGRNESVEGLLKQADLAMYKAKDSGRNAVRFFDPGMQSSLDERITLERDLRSALEEDQLIAYYQPQINHYGQVIGAEVLMRWHHPDRGLVSPGQFIPVAESTGLIVPLGAWILNAACQQISAWSQVDGLSDLQVSVNVSAIEFRQENFVDKVSKIISKTGVDPSRLKLELTESAVLEDVAGTFEKMAVLKDLGIGFALDDFGTGHSSLAYLTRLPLDTLKIDSSFVFKLPDSATDAVIAQTIISMARSLGLKVIAEGVETSAQRDFLASHECYEYQGFLFSRPLPVEAFEQYCRSQ